MYSVLWHVSILCIMGIGLRRWIDEQISNQMAAKVAVLYASAYGNTASLAQAISRGITKAGVGVEMVNLEQVSTSEAEEVLLGSQGFCIGTPFRQHLAFLARRSCLGSCVPGPCQINDSD